MSDNLLRDSPSRHIGRHDVHLWWFTLDERNLDGRHLTADERERATCFANERDGLRFLVGRSLLREVCASYGAADVAHDPQGRPHVLGVPITCSLAHSADLVLVTVAVRPIGVDVERSSGQAPDDALIRESCTAPQRWRLARTAPALREEAFLRHWVRKEALCKALGSGLDLRVSGRSMSFRRDADGRRPQSWRVRDLEAPAGYRAAVAASGLDWGATVQAAAPRAT